MNDECGDVNVAFHYDRDGSRTGQDTVPTVAESFKQRGEPWALVADENYGEGSAREHAALQPRFYGETLAIHRYRFIDIIFHQQRMCNDHCQVIFSDP